MLEFLNGFDFWFLHLAQSLSSLLLDLFFKYATYLGNPIVWMLFSAYIYWKGKANDSFFFMNNVVFSTTVTGLAKPVIGRLRPDPEIFRVVNPDIFSKFSFPSGHATMIGSVLGYYHKWIAGYKKLLLVAIAIIVMYSRLYLGAHFLTDVLGGIILGFAIGKVNFYFRKTWVKHNFRLGRLKDEITLVIIIFFSIAALLFFSSLPLVAALLGYYTGFFYIKEMQLKFKPMRRRKMLVKQAIGFAILAGIMLSSGHPINDYTAYDARVFMVFFLAGLWVTAIWPLIWEGFFSGTIHKVKILVGSK